MSPVAHAVCFAMLAAGDYPAPPREEHPLVPVIRFAEEGLRQIDVQLKDYTCTLVKRERINGRLASPGSAAVKLRHQQVRDGEVVVPFSVYMRFSAPSRQKGHEAVYVQGQHQGRVIGHNGLRAAHVTLAVPPRSELAMRGNHYPITEMGVRNMIERLLEVAREELGYDETEVEYFAGAKVNDRACTVIQVTHPVPRDHFRYHLARVFIDDELRLPIRYASYDWPKQAGGKPRLIEEYTFLDLKLNVGLSDRDFDYRNPDYMFRKDFRP